MESRANTRRLEEGPRGFRAPLPRDGRDETGRGPCELFIHLCCPPPTTAAAAANRAPTVPPPRPAAFNLPCSSLPPRYSQRFAEAETCGNFGSSSSWQWRNKNTTTAAVRAAFAHRKRGSGFPAPKKIPLAASRMENFVLSSLSPSGRLVLPFGRFGVKKVSAGGIGGKRLAASTLECQFKFWNDISPPKKKKDGILWGVHARLGVPTPFHHLVFKHREVRRGKKVNNECKLLMEMYLGQ